MKIEAKVNAFTIIEVTVSMLLAAISIAIAYTSYRVVSSSYQRFDTKNKNVSEFLFADKALKKDISFCSRMICIDDGISLITTEGEIIYRFSPDYILRNQFNLRTDTLFLRSAELRSSFEQQEVFSGDLADRTSFIATLEDKTISLTYKKDYSAEELFK